MPKRVPTVEWKLLESQEEIQDGIRVRRKELVGVVDNRGYPAVQVGIRMQLTVPVSKASASPVIMELGFIGPNPFAPPGRAARLASNGAGEWLGCRHHRSTEHPGR